MEDIKLFEDEEKEVKIVNHDIFKKPTKTFIITFKKKRKIISTLDGFKEINIVGNNYVPKELWKMKYTEWQNYKKEVIKSLGYKEKEVSLLYTGVDIENFGFYEEKSGDYKISCYATAGVKSNALRIGFDEGKFYEKDGEFFEAGTINVILLADTFLNEGTIVSSIIQIQGVIQNLEN